MTLYQWAMEITEWRKSKGFETPGTIGGEDANKMLGKLMLVVTEIAEAAEAVRHENYINFEEEIADTFIRLLDICGAMQIDPDRIVREKMIINGARPFRHGKKTSL